MVQYWHGEKLQGGLDVVRRLAREKMRSTLKIITAEGYYRVSGTRTLQGALLQLQDFYSSMITSEIQRHGVLVSWVPFLCVSGVLMYISAFSIGMGAVPWVIMSEIFPINVKGVARNLVALVNCTGAWFVFYTFNFLMSWSMSGTTYIFAGFCASTVMFVAKVVPETKGKTLEEIQVSINPPQETLA
ncbi:Sugar transporter ERD6-like 16-like protein [Drosera capensis]